MQRRRDIVRLQNDSAPDKKQRSFDYCSPNKASDKAAYKQICCLIRWQRSSGWKQDLRVNPAQLSHDTGASNTPPQSCSFIERCQLFCPVQCLLVKSLCQIWRYDRFYGEGLKHRSGVTLSYKTKIGLCILCLISRGTRSFARARSGTCGSSGVPPWLLFVDFASALGLLVHSPDHLSWLPNFELTPSTFEERIVEMSQILQQPSHMVR